MKKDTGPIYRQVQADIHTGTMQIYRQELGRYTDRPRQMYRQLQADIHTGRVSYTDRHMYCRYTVQTDNK